LLCYIQCAVGEPKAIPWTHTTPLRCGADAFFHQDVRPGDVLCWPTNMGWMMGPWLVYAALLNSATIAIFQGSPLGRPFGQFIERARVTALGLVPSIVKGWRATGCMKGLDWSCLRCYRRAGSWLHCLKPLVAFSRLVCSCTMCLTQCSSLPLLFLQLHWGGLRPR
jgi:acetyl-CoA synthetase